MPQNGEEPSDDEEIGQLSDVYSVLKHDAKSIVLDLEGGVMMWREAAAGAAACTGFIIFLILTTFKFYNLGWSAEGWAYIIGSIVVAGVMAVISATGFQKYFRLRKKYSTLFQKAQKM